MQRRDSTPPRTRIAGTALALAVAFGLTACTGVSGDEAADTKGGEIATPAEPAPPGRYQTLPEPCGAVGRDMLEDMLPGAAAKAQEQRGGTDGSPSPLEGEAALTFDTDRRVGCTWQSATSLGSRRLTVEFERVVSYDPEVSDDERAETLYEERAARAGVTEDDATGEPSGQAPDESGAAGGSPDAPRNGSPDETSGGPSGTPSGGTESGEATALASPSPKPSLPPRTLPDIGDAAFIDDRLKSTPDGRGSHRRVTLLFRTSNVLVTVEYSQSIADAHRTPSSAELQEHTQELARRLAEQFTET